MADFVGGFSLEPTFKAFKAFSKATFSSFVEVEDVEDSSTWEEVSVAELWLVEEGVTEVLEVFPQATKANIDKLSAKKLIFFIVWTSFIYT